MKFREGITAEELRSILDYDQKTGIFTHRDGPFRRNKAGQIAGSVSDQGRKRYYVISVKRKIYTAHRLAWLYMTGEWPKKQIDHINGDSLDNRIVNLREATDSQNRVNSPAYVHSKTGQRGIHVHACGRYRVQLQKDNKPIHIGYFDTLNSAIEARDVAYREIHGEFARL